MSANLNVHFTAFKETIFIDLLPICLFLGLDKMTNHPEKKPAGRHLFTQFKNSAKNYSIRSAIAAVHVEQPNRLDRPTSGAESTETISPEKHRLTHLKTTLRSFGKETRSDVWCCC